MSKLKIKKYSMFIMLAVLAVLIFGCDNKTPVKDIYFAHEEQVVMLVGETIKPNVVVTPSYASNVKYTLSSSNEAVVEISGENIIAKQEGVSTVKVVANDNKVLEDVITVNVRKHPIVLETPTNLKYSTNTQTISFDEVHNASSYTMRINGVELELGNSTKLSLADLDKTDIKAFDNLLKIEVRANAPHYTKAFEKSDFTRMLEIYQNGKVENVIVENGILKFKEKSNEDFPTVYDVLINQSLWKNGVANDGIDVTSLDSKYAGQNIEISVIARTAGKSSNMGFFPSVRNGVGVSVLNSPELKLDNTQLSWDMVSKAGKYSISINGEEKEVLTENHLTLEEIDNLQIEEGNVYTISLMVNLPENSINVAKTKKVSQIRFSKLATPEVSISNSEINWTSSDKITAYEIILEDEQVLIDSSTLATSLSMKNYESGKDYKFTIKAIGNKDLTTGVYYISSDTTEFEFRKNAIVDARIENYAIKFNAEIGERYSIAVDGNPVEIVTAEVEDFSYNLKNINFDQGQHEVVLYNLGNLTNSVDGGVSSVFFTQLGDIESLTLDKNTLTAVSSEFNISNLAQIAIFVARGDEEVLSVEQENLIIEQNVLSAGDYVAYAEVLGDGSSTFSFMQNGENVKCKVINFSVLHAPELALVSSTESKFAFELLNDAVVYDLFCNEQPVGTLTKEDIDAFIAGETDKIKPPFAVDGQTVTYSFELGNGESVQYSIIARGDGKVFLDSPTLAPYTISRLALPNIKFNNKTNVVDVEINNQLEDIKEYVFKHNGNDVDLTTWNFGEEFKNFEIGRNSFELYLEPANNNCLRSYTDRLDVQKIDSYTNISINSNNQLVLQPENHAKQFLFDLKFDCGGTIIEMKANGKEVVYGTHKFAYKYENGKYIINSILNKNYISLIENFKNNFTVSVCYYATNANELFVRSDYSNVVNVELLNKTTVVRDGQYITFNNVYELNTYSDYALLINGEEVVEINNTAIVDTDAQIIKVPVSYFEHLATEEINTVAVITKNTNSKVNNPTLSVVSDAVKFKVEQTPTLVSSKNNLSTNNSVVVSFETYKTDYEKSYIVYIYNNELVDGVTKIFIDSEAIDGVISFNLDDVNLEGRINIVAMVEAEYDDLTNLDEPIYHFNSPKSAPITFQKPNKTTNLAVVNGNLVFSEIANVVGYEIYEKVDGSYRKLSSSIVTSNSYSLTSLEGTRELAVKGISVEQVKNRLYTNTSISDSIKINKIETPTISLHYGDFAFGLSANAMALLQSEQDDCELVVINGRKEFSFKITATSQIVGTNLIVPAYQILNYGQSTFINEKIQAYVRANSTNAQSEVQYVNSNSVEFDAVGMFAPINAGKTTNSTTEFEFVEFITWQTNSKNVYNDEAIENSYQFKIEYDGTTYYSFDNNLMWLDGAIYKSYPTYIAKSESSYQQIVFPAGYDEDGNGSLSDDEKFGAGEYKVAIRVIPTAMQGVNLCASSYCLEYSFEIMDKITLSAKEGVVSWEDNSKATGYIVKVFEHNGTEPIKIKTIYTNSYKLEDVSNGIYGVQVQAINTTNPAILNGEVSDIVEFYRLPKVEKVYVDDGRLYITADNLFAYAELEFVDIKNVEHIEKITFENIENNNNIQDLSKKLNAKNWTEVSSYETNPQTYVVNVEESTILKLTEGGSFKINVTLKGNSNNQFGVITGEKSESVHNLIATKLSSSKIFSVDSGILTFSLDNEYKTTLEVNNNINNQASQDVFLKNAPLFEIQVAVAGVVHNIYAIDYNYFEANKESVIDNCKIFDASQEAGFGDLYAYYCYNYLDGTNKKLLLNVFYNNKINLKQHDYLRYYAVSQTYDEDNNCYNWQGVESDNNYTSINLAEGGTFVVTVSLLGGDQNNTNAFLTANQKTTEKFVRYEINSIATTDGLIEFNNLETDVDAPVYRMIFENTAHEKTLVYLYNDNRTVVEEIMAKDEALLAGQITGESLFIKLDRSNMFGGKIRFEMSNYFPADTYSVNIKTLAGVGKSVQNSWDYLLDSKNPETSWTIRQLQESEVGYSDGFISFDRGYVLGDESNEYYDRYEVTIYATGGKTVVYNLTETSKDVTIDRKNNKIIYDLPTKVSDRKAQINFEPDKVYQIKIRPISNMPGITNGKYIKDADLDDKLFKFKVSSGVTEFKVEDGILKWTPNSTDNKFILKFIYKDSNGIERVIYPSDVQDGSSSYTISDGIYKIDGADLYPTIESQFDYRVELTSYNSVSLDGVITLRSNEAVIEKMNRLQTVDRNSIKTFDGVLVWDSVPNATHYKVVISNEFTYITTETQLDLLQVLEENEKILPVGEHSIKIRAYGNEFITASNSAQSEKFVKLSAVDVNKILIEEDGNTVSWPAINDVSAFGELNYEIVVRYNYNEDTGLFEETEPKNFNTNSFKISDFDIAISGKYEIKISVISVGEGYMFNGGSVVYVSKFDAPDPVTDIETNETETAYIWSTQGQMANGDVFIINYKLNNEAQETIRMPYIAGVEDYSFEFKTIGLYSEFMITVRRPGGFSSEVKIAKQFDFNFFKAGDGSELYPYEIENETQLMNISKFPDKNFVLVQNITLSSANILNGEGGIIAKEFFGTLSGSYGENNYGINFESGSEGINIGKISNFALFGTLNGATVENLSIGRTESSTKFVNSVDFESGNMLNLSLIAIEAKNKSTIDGIVLNKIEIVLGIARKLESGVFVSGAVAKLEDSTLSNVTAENMVITLNNNISAIYTRLGGLVAVAKDNATIKDSEINLTINSKLTTDYANRYIGGVVAQVTRSTGVSGNTTISNVNATVNTSAIDSALETKNVYATYFGAIAGLTEYATISSCSVDGTYRAEEHAMIANMGGVVGYASNTEITDVTSRYQFEIGSLTGADQYIGAIVGDLRSKSTIENYVVDATVSTSVTIIVGGKITTLGIYGNLAS